MQLIFLQCLSLFQTIANNWKNLKSVYSNATILLAGQNMYKPQKTMNRLRDNEKRKEYPVSLSK